jgi:xanthine/CO dehydrogenase XdhC/CoxF family maturation factor
VKEISEIIRLFEQSQERTFALATLVRARGSTYRRAGARMLVRQDGCTVGSLSGGCLEEEVAMLARSVIETGKPKLVPFDMRRRFGCNGEIEIFIERLNAQFLIDLRKHVEERRSCIAETHFDDPVTGSRIEEVDATNPIADRKPGVFVQRIDPPIQLVVIGGGHDAFPFRPLCELLGWQFVEAASIDDAPQNFDSWTAAIVKTHHYGRDFAALQKLVPRGLRYLGLIGPRRRRDQLLADLVDITGPIDAELFAPAGLDLGAETPEEIALAVIAEIQSVFAAASAESLRNRKTPIHPINYDLPRSVRSVR